MKRIVRLAIIRTNAARDELAAARRHVDNLREQVAEGECDKYELQHALDDERIAESDLEVALRNERDDRRS